MAVYVVKKNNPWGYWGANLGNGLFDNIIGGMFARDAQARQTRRNRALYADASKTMTPQPGLPQPEAPRPQYSEDVQSLANSATRGMPTATDNQGWKGLWDSTVGLGKEYRPGREELLGVFGRHGVTPQEAELLMNYYKNQFETADKLGYQDEVASRVNNLDYDVRNNPARATQSGLTAQAYGLSPQGLWQYTYPNITSGVMDNGNRNTFYRMNPATGDTFTQDFTKAVDPDTAYKSNADIQEARIRSAPRFTPTYGANGEIYAFNDRTGGVSETGKMSYPRYGLGNGAPAGPKPLTPEQRMKISQEALRYAQQGGTPEDVWNQVVNVAGSNPEVLTLMANSVFGTPQLPPAQDYGEPQANPYYNRIPAAAAEFFRTGNIRNAGTGAAQAQATQVSMPPSDGQASPIMLTAEELRKYAQDSGMTVEQARAQIEREGGVIR